MHNVDVDDCQSGGTIADQRCSGVELKVLICMRCIIASGVIHDISQLCHWSFKALVSLHSV